MKIIKNICGALCLSSVSMLVLADKPLATGTDALTHASKATDAQWHGKKCMEGPHGEGHPAHGQIVMIPRLPEGNDKLQLKMEAEVYQKIGEIMAKYAEQLH